MMVSIIVPVYNTGKYLRECIESVLQQSYQEWELLLMDDGSTDDSGKICDEYASFDSRIKVVHKNNTGVSDTRNKALDLAVGKYVIFLDSDDYWTNNKILELFVNTSIKYDLDIVRANYYEVDADGNRLNPICKGRKVELSCKILPYLQYLKDIVCGEYFACLFIIKKDSLGNHKFNSARVFMEDKELYFSLIEKSLRCMYLHEDFYAYRKHVDAASVRYNVNKYRDAFQISELCCDLSLKVSDSNTKMFLASEAINNFLVYFRSISLDRQLKINRYNVIDELGLKELKYQILSLSEYIESQYKKVLISLPIKILVYYFICDYNLKKYCRLFLMCLKRADLSVK